MTVYALSGKRVWVAGHRGMVGSAIVRRLRNEGCEMLTAGRETVDLTQQAEVEAWMAETRPQAVFLAAAKVGGILANDTRPAEFLYENLMIEANIIHAAHRTGVEKLLFLGSSCIYPKFAPQPIVEEALLTGPLEPTNEWYAIAKIAGIKLCQAYRRQYGADFISAMPTNLYGPGDNYDLQGSHVIPALLLKAHAAKREGRRDLPIWGTGTPRREFLHADDCADALVLLMKAYSGREPCQCRLGRGHSDPRPRPSGDEGGRAEGRAGSGPLQAGRHAAKTDERREARRHGVEAPDQPRGGLRAVYAGPPFA
jgi:GDP-L-fucose synthase